MRVVVSEIEETDSHVSSGQLLYKNEGVRTSIGAELVAAAALRILVDRDEIRIGQDRTGRIVHIADVAADDQRRIHHGPQCEVRLILGIIAAADGRLGIQSLAVHAYYQNIHVVIAARPAVLLLLQLAERDLLNGPPRVLNIDRGTESVGARGADPLMHFVPSPLAGREHNIPAAASERQIHPAIQHFGRKRRRMVAVVILEVVDAPLRELLRVLKFMFKAARITGAGVNAAAGVDAQL